jgi:hypothetical protein
MASFKVLKPFPSLCYWMGGSDSRRSVLDLPYGGIKFWHSVPWPVTSHSYDTPSYGLSLHTAMTLRHISHHFTQSWHSVPYPIISHSYDTPSHRLSLHTAMTLRPMVCHSTQLWHCVPYPITSHSYDIPSHGLSPQRAVFSREKELRTTWN